MRSLTLSPLSGPPPPPPLYTHTLRHQCGTWVTGRDVVVGNEAVIDETRRLSFTVSLQQLQPRPEKFTDESSPFFLSLRKPRFQSFYIQETWFNPAGPCGGQRAARSEKTEMIIGRKIIIRLK